MTYTFKVMLDGRKLAEFPTLCKAQAWIAKHTQEMPTDTRAAIAIVEQSRA